MPNQPPDPSPGSEEPRIISDQQMVFRSAEDPLPKAPSKKAKVKAAKLRNNTRKDTPAPPSKGDGRKRFDNSPLAEDKQLRNRLSFGDEDSPGLTNLKCKVGLASSFLELDEDKNPNLVRRAFSTDGGKVSPDSIGQTNKDDDAPPPISGQTSGDSMILVGQGEDKSPCHPQEDKAAPCEVQEALVEVQVNLPHLEKRTNALLESTLVSFQTNESRESLAVALSRQPNLDNTLDLTPLDTTEKMDTMVEQPLLAGAQPEDVRTMTISHLPSPPTMDITPDEPMPKRDNFVHLASLNATETMDLMAAQPLLARKQPEVVHSAVVNQALPKTPNEQASDVLMLPYNPPFDDFPPLERGRTRKIRDSFESGEPRTGATRTCPRVKSNDQGVTETDNLVRTSEGAKSPCAEEDRRRDQQSGVGCGPSTKVGGAWSIPRAGIDPAVRQPVKPISMADMVREMIKITQLSLLKAEGLSVPYWMLA